MTQFLGFCWGVLTMLVGLFGLSSFTTFSSEHPYLHFGRESFIFLFFFMSGVLICVNAMLEKDTVLSLGLSILFAVSMLFLWICISLDLYVSWITQTLMTPGVYSFIFFVWTVGFTWIHLLSVGLRYARYRIGVYVVMTLVVCLMILTWVIAQSGHSGWSLASQTQTYFTLLATSILGTIVVLCLPYVLVKCRGFLNGTHEP
jgi:hypothetical protein